MSLFPEHYGDNLVATSIEDYGTTFIGFQRGELLLGEIYQLHLFE